MIHPAESLKTANFGGKTRRRLLIVAYRYPPDQDSGARRPSKLAKYLRQFGWECVIVTHRNPSWKQGKVATNNGHPTLTRTLALNPRGTGSIVRWLARCKANDLCWMIWRPEWYAYHWHKQAKKLAARLCTLHGIDAIWTTAPPFTSHLIGLYLKQRLNLPWIADYRDPWTTAVVRSWPTKWHFRIEERWERSVLCLTDAITCVTPTMCQRLVTRFPQAGTKVRLLYNGYDPADYPPPSPLPSFSVLRVGYAGSLAPWTARQHSPYGRCLQTVFGPFVYQPGQHDLSAHSPLYLFRALRTLIDRFPSYGSRVQITLIGEVAKENLELVESLGLQQHVTFTGRLSQSRAVEELSKCNLFFLPMRVIYDERGYDLSGKLYDYIALRRPILALTNPGDLSDFLTKYKLGWCLDPYDDLRVAQLFKSILDNPQVVNDAFAPDESQLSQLSYPRLAEALAQLLDRCLGMA